MCDTMVATGSITKSGNVIFAKNSDRESNEAQVLLRIPRKKYDLNSEPKLKTTYIEIPQVEETNEIVISKPSWMWGCEMGCNEFSVTIGNEAVFTKEKHGEASLIGMDIIRLALERTKSAEEALNYIIYLLGEYGQGGRCSETSNMKYHNSFIIADKKDAFVLETAGKYWVYKKIEGFYAISNGLTLENDFDKCHPDLIKDSIEKKMCTGRGDFNFRKSYADPIYLKFSHCDARTSLAKEMVKAEMGNITLETMMMVLRGHQKDSGDNFKKGSMKNICMHGGSLISSQTTASFIGELKDISEYWYTASSLPCISIFKPLALNSDFQLFEEKHQEKAIEYWRKRENIGRMFLTGQLKEAEYKKEMASVQNKIKEIYGKINLKADSRETIGDALRQCMNLDNEFVDNMLLKGKSVKPQRIKGSIVFKRYWKKVNLEFNLKNK